MFSEINEHMGAADMANPRTYVLDDKKTEIKLERRDPYGFVYIEWTDGKTPKEFVASTFTSFDEARKHLDAYLLNNKK